MILKKIGQFPAGGPHLANIRLEFEQLFSDRLQLIITQVIQVAWIGLVEAQHLCAHVDRGEVIPNRNFAAVLRIPENVPGVRWLRKNSGVVNQRIGSPHERRAVDLTIHPHQR